MNARREPPDSLDFFPTPPWATRALLVHVIGDLRLGCVWEPAAGRGHMAETLAERAFRVIASDVFDYGRGYELGSFVGQGPDVIGSKEVDWVITNPPFALATEFVERGLREARVGVALLLRSNWAEGAERFERIFSKTPPTVIAQFVERVPMVKGRYDPNASTATCYAWFVWRRPSPNPTTRFMWIPPCRRELSRPSDLRFEELST